MVAFVRDYRPNKETLKLKRSELAQMDGAKAITISGMPSGSGVHSDGTADTAAEREELSKEIQRCERRKYLFEYAYQVLTDDERLVFDAFVFWRGMTSINLREVEKRIHYSQAEIYRIRRNALGKMQEEVFRQKEKLAW